MRAYFLFLLFLLVLCVVLRDLDNDDKALNTPETETSEDYSYKLMDEYYFDDQDDALTVASYIMGEDTTRSEVIDRYQAVIDSEQVHNQ